MRRVYNLADKVGGAKDGVVSQQELIDTINAEIAKGEGEGEGEGEG